MLLLLAKIERDLATVQFYALGDVYLQECITRFPKNPVAKKCFQEYSVSIQQRFGPTVPEYLTNSLQSMRKELGLRDDKN
jgi:hypothetical protein